MRNSGLVGINGGIGLQLFFNSVVGMIYPFIASVIRKIIKMKSNHIEKAMN